MPNWSRYPGRFSIILLSVAALFLLLEAVNGRLWLNDFRVYYEASGALLRGDAPYGVAHGLSSGFFKYAPVLGFLYAPLAMLPYPLAAAVQFALIVLAFNGALLKADHIIRVWALPLKAASYLPLFLCLLITGAHLHRELHLGNINTLLLLLLMAGLQALLVGRRQLAGLLWGLAILTKPHFIVLVPWLMLRSEWQVLRWALVSIALGIFLPLPFIGFAEWKELHAAWINAMASHNAALVYTGGGERQMIDTAYSFAHRAFFGKVLGWRTAATVIMVLAMVALAMGALVLRNRLKEMPGQRTMNLLSEAFLILALVPSLTVTDTNHFLFAMPLILLVVHRLVPKPAPRWLWLAAIPILLAHGGNWSDALGPLSDTLTHFGVLGMANVTLAVLGFCLFFLGLNQARFKASKQPNRP